MTVAAPATSTAAELARMVSQSYAPRVRSMREWSEAEMILPPGGPFAGLRFRVARQPYVGAWLDLLDSGQYQRHAFTGPAQASKTWSGFVIPVMYHLFEVGETVIAAAPTDEICQDKWTRDLLPAIRASRYADLLPSSGGGSRGGSATSYQFGNGATLRFMTGGGSDKSVAGYTSRVVVATEIDGMDEVRGKSREADRISQIEARTNAFGDRRRIYLECTTSYESGRIWQEYLGGTGTQLALPCYACGEFVTPEREHLVGWKGAADEIEARDGTGLACPRCGALWDEDQRRDANAAAVAVHRGQTVNQDGKVAGDAPRTLTASFRATAANNLFVPLAAVGAEEWKAERSNDPVAPERKMRQFYWALPAQEATLDLTELDPDDVAKTRSIGLPRGHVPPTSRMLALGVDVGKHLLHWSLVSLGVDEAPHVADYGRVEVGIDTAPAEVAVPRALLALRERCTQGWTAGAGANVSPAVAWVDEGYLTQQVRGFCASDSSRSWFPARGLGWHQKKTGKNKRAYTAPKRKSKSVAVIGDGWHIVRLVSPRGLRAAHVSADQWKTWLHARFALEAGAPGAATLYATTSPSDHLPFTRHLTAERRVREVKAGVGQIERWENPTGRNNHWLDATCLAVAAGHYALAIGAKSSGSAAAKSKGDWFGNRRKKRSG